MNQTIRKETIGSIGLILITFGVFFLPRCIRLIFLGQSIGGLNAIPFIGCMLIIYGKLFAKKAKHKYRTLLFFLILFIMFIWLFIVEYQAHAAKFSMMLTLLVNFLMPLILFSRDDLKFDKSDVETCIRIMNIAIYITYASGLINIVTGGYVSRLIGNLSHDAFYILLSRGSRWFTWYGHYLYSGEIFLIYYIVNVFYSRKIKKRKEPLYVSIIAISAALLVGSKTCAVLMIVMLVILNIQKFRYSFTTVALILILYYVGAFDLVISRIDPENLSTGRVETLKYLLERNINLFPIFMGHGTNYISILRQSYASASAGLEFVLLQIAAYFGCVFSAIFGIVIFVKPLFKSIKQRDFLLFLCMAVLILDVNSYNGLATFQDQSYAYAWTISIMYIIMQVEDSEESDRYEVSL